MSCVIGRFSAMRNVHELFSGLRADALSVVFVRDVGATNVCWVLKQMSCERSCEAFVMSVISAQDSSSTRAVSRSYVFSL